MKRNNNGATVWARKTVESDVFFSKPDKWFKIWFYIISHVNYADCKELKKGENFMTYSEIKLYTKATKSQIDKFIRWSKADDMLTTRKTTRGMIITVLNYAKYQTMDNYKSDTGKSTQTTARRQQDDTIKEEIKNIRNKESIIYSELSSQIQEVMKIFYSINPTLNWGNKTSRSSAEYLIKKFGFEGTKKMAEQAVAIQGQPYAPTATTPTQLKDRLAQFKIYFDKEKNMQEKNKPNIAFIS